jgi:hypothetical protein
MNRSQETRLKKLRAKLEQVRSACARRYCFHFDEVAEAEAQGLPALSCIASLCASAMARSQVSCDSSAALRIFAITAWPASSAEILDCWPARRLFRPLKNRFFDPRAILPDSYLSFQIAH